MKSILSLGLIAFLSACASKKADTTPNDESRAFQKELQVHSAEVQAACRSFDEEGNRLAKGARRFDAGANSAKDRAELVNFIGQLKKFPPYPAKAGELQKALLEDNVPRIDPLWLLSNVILKDSCRFLEFNLTSSIFVAIEKKQLGTIDQKNFYRILLKRIGENPEHDTLIRLLMLSNWMGNMATATGSAFTEAQRKEAAKIKQQAFELSDKYKNREDLTAKLSADKEREIAIDMAQTTPEAIREARPVFKNLKKLASQIQL